MDLSYILHVVSWCFTFVRDFMKISFFQFTEQTGVHGGNDYFQSSKGNNSKSRQIRVTVHVFCILSHGALYLCEVSGKYQEQYQSYEVDTSTWQKWLCSMGNLCNLDMP